MADTPIQDRELKLPRTKIGGRYVTAYDPERALEIVERISEGETLKFITRRDGGTVAASTFRRWLTMVPALRDAYEEARKLSAYSFEDEALELGKDLMASPGTAQKVRAFDLMLNQLRWSAGKRNPEKFGEKSALSLVVPVQFNTTLDMGGKGTSNNTAEHPDIYAIDVTPKQVEAPARSIMDDIPTLSEKLSGPRKQVLTPRIPMDAETPLKPRTENGLPRDGSGLDQFWNKEGNSDE